MALAKLDHVLETQDTAARLSSSHQPKLLIVPHGSIRILSFSVARPFNMQLGNHLVR